MYASGRSGVSNALKYHDEQLAFCAVRDFVVHCVQRVHACSLHSDVTASSKKYWYGDEAVSCGAPEVLDDEILRPFICNADLGSSQSVPVPLAAGQAHLVYRVDVPDES